MPLGEERLLLVEVRLDRFADLDAPQGRFVHVACGLARHQLHAVGEAHRCRCGVDVGNDEAFVLFQPAGNIE